MPVLAGGWALLRHLFPAGMGVCQVSNNSHSVSFDGSHHAIRGTCTYVLVKTCHSTMDLPFFKISGKNGKREGQTPTFYLYQVNIDVFDSLVTLKKGHRVLVSWATWAGIKEASSGDGALVLLPTHQPSPPL